MWTLNRIVLCVISCGIVAMPVTASASWAQIDKATKDQVLKRSTEEGSKAFLSGTIKVQQAMRSLDDGNLESAAGVGLEAVKEFDAARANFQAAVDRIKGTKVIQDELSQYLKSVIYEPKAAELGAAVARSTLWLSIQKTAAGEQGAAQLFESAASRAKALGDKCGKFFQTVKAKDYNPLNGASLLVQLGGDLIFGAYVSAVFAK